MAAERKHRRQIVLQVALGAVAGCTCRYLGEVGPPIDEKEFTGENVIPGRSRRGGAVDACLSLKAFAHLRIQMTPPLRDGLRHYGFVQPGRPQTALEINLLTPVKVDERWLSNGKKYEKNRPEFFDASIRSNET